MYKLLQQSITNGQVKEYEGCYLIYPNRFVNINALKDLLISLQKDYDLSNVMGTIKAIPKIISAIEA